MDELLITKRAVETFGAEHQIFMAIEECSELIDALCKLRRGRVEPDAVITEIADVQIVMGSLSHIFGINKVAAERIRKVERLERRITAHDDNGK